MIEELKQTATGAAVLAEWLGNGAWPVSSKLANERAKICAQCPMNVAPNWWGSATGAIADKIREHLSAKRTAKLTVDNEDQLHMCKVCGCANPLKVHVPIVHIRNHTDEKVLSQFPFNCWIPKELIE